MVKEEVISAEQERFRQRLLRAVGWTCLGARRSPGTMEIWLYLGPTDELPTFLYDALLMVLRVQCPWRIEDAERILVGYGDTRLNRDDGYIYPTERVRAIRVLRDRRLERIECRPPAYELDLRFDQGYRLRVFPAGPFGAQAELTDDDLPWLLI